MPCLHPISAYVSRLPYTATGKRKIAFKPAVGFDAVDLPCGQCYFCRLNRAREWAIRCIHEVLLYKEASFITLTYDDEHLPSGKTLVVADLQKFFKRLRKAGMKIRYLACGEYGDRTQRPHYHAIIFGKKFESKQIWERLADGKMHTRRASAELQRYWHNGLVSADEFSFDSACYVAGYCLKKITGEPAKAYYGDRKPPFLLTSKRPAIGQRFFDRYGESLSTLMSTVVNSKEVRLPRFYLKKIEKDYPDRFKKYKDELQKLYLDTGFLLDIEQRRLTLAKKLKYKHLQIPIREC